MTTPKALNRHMHHSRTRLVVMAAAGIAAAIVASWLGSWAYAPIIGWAVACLVYMSWVWIKVLPMNAQRTAAHATAEDPSRPVADLLLIGASVASLVAVVFVLMDATQKSNDVKALIAVLAVVSVALSWALVHTLFTLRYASLFYHDQNGGVGFNQKEPPRYSDFAYLAFTIGMTFQVSDTNITSTVMRSTALRHALLSYLFGTVILATMINLVAGLSSSH